MLFGLQPLAGQRLVQRQRGLARLSGGDPHVAGGRQRPVAGRVVGRRQVGGAFERGRRLGELSGLARLDRAARLRLLGQDRRAGRARRAKLRRGRRRGSGSYDDALHEADELDQDRVDLMRLAQAVSGPFDEAKLDIG